MYGLFEDGPFVDKYIVIPDDQEPPPTITVRAVANNPAAEKGAEEFHNYQFNGYRGAPQSAAFYVYRRESVDPAEPTLEAHDGPPPVAS